MIVLRRHVFVCSHGFLCASGLHHQGLNEKPLLGLILLWQEDGWFTEEVNLGQTASLLCVGQVVPAHNSISREGQEERLLRGHMLHGLQPGGFP